MILVTLGTQKQSFERLLNMIENSSLKDEIIVQAGYTNFKSKKMKIFNFVDYEKMEELVNRADLIITHGGTGSILGPLKKGKKVIACARLKRYGEHVDDHQMQLIEAFSDAGYIISIGEKDNIDEVISKLKNKKMLKFKSNNKKFIDKLKKEIEMC